MSSHRITILPWGNYETGQIIRFMSADYILVCFMNHRINNIIDFQLEINYVHRLLNGASGSGQPSLTIFPKDKNKFQILPLKFGIIQIFQWSEF